MSGARLSSVEELTQAQLAEIEACKIQAQIDQVRDEEWSRVLYERAKKDKVHAEVDVRVINEQNSKLLPRSKNKNDDEGTVVVDESFINICLHCWCDWC
jgi:hypothetical protein